MAQQAIVEEPASPSAPPKPNCLPVSHLRPWGKSEAKHSSTTLAAAIAEGILGHGALGLDPKDLSSQPDSASYFSCLNKLLGFFKFYFLIYNEGLVQLYGLNGNIEMKELHELQSTQQMLKFLI